MAELELLKEQNPWWIAKEKIEEDVNLGKLSVVKYVWHPEILGTFNLEKDVIYTLRGSRQIGKTTALKLLVKKLLENNPKENIFYFTCNNVDDYKGLIEILRAYLDWNETGRRKYIFVDEITFVKNWTRAIKYLTDLGRLKNCTMILTGSNAHDLKYEIERLPGRRGQDPQLDKILFPLSFREYVGFVNPDIAARFLDIESAKKNYPFYKKELEKYLNNYIMTGGFIQAINSLVNNGIIGIDIYQQYLSWALGDLAKFGKKEIYSRQIFRELISSITTNIGFDTIAKKTSIGSHMTVGDYLDVMESNFIIKILYQVDINKKISATRKTKKIYFQDVFLFWVFLGYVFGLSDYFSSGKLRLNEPLFKSKIVENLVMSRLIKLEDTLNWANIVFFFRTTNQIEVDFIVKSYQGDLLPIEVKYQNNVTDGDFHKLDKISKEKGIIVSKEDFLIKGSKYILPLEVFLLTPLNIR